MACGVLEDREQTMNVRKIKREMGGGVVVTRNAKARTVRVEACGLGYRYSAGEAAFRDERELADYVRSKLPAGRAMGNGQ